MKIDVKRIAELAKLEIEENRLEEFERDMKAITEIADQFPVINSDEMLFNTNEMTLREDSINPEKPSRAQMLSVAPETESGYISVPRTV